MSDSQHSTRRRLKLDLDELKSAFDGGSVELRWFLDLRTGLSVLISDETREEVEAVEEEVAETLGSEDRDEAFATALAAIDLPAWVREVVREMDPLPDDHDAAYIEIPQLESHEGYSDMEAFIETMPDPRLRDRLWDAIHGRGAFRRFNDVLVNFPAERERWFAFSDTRLEARVLA
ncbi:MAG: UPF0158 family protein [Dehalococcoidia bacterium]